MKPSEGDLKTAREVYERLDFPLPPEGPREDNIAIIAAALAGERAKAGQHCSDRCLEKRDWLRERNRKPCGADLESLAYEFRNLNNGSKP